MVNQETTVKNIRSFYETKKEEQSKMEKLVALDKKVKRPAEVFAYTFGTVGSLVFGTGMCLALGAIGSSLPLGVAVGVLGAVLCGITYPAYKAIMKKRKAKYADEIIRLSDELLNN
ncbi:MAG: dihydropteridine reductase [Clostridia bacterium]|nr:dihydropteridine reductase [Clostridia bacterium]